MLPNQPWFIPFFTVKSSTVSSSPSSIPVMRALSDCLSYALIRSIMFTGKFCKPVFTSPPKNSLPPTMIFLISLPLIFTLPFSSISAPGSFLTNSSNMAPSGVRYAEALYPNVSPETVTCGASAVTTASLNIIASDDKRIFPTFTVGLEDTNSYPF